MKERGIIVTAFALLLISYLATGFSNTGYAGAAQFQEGIGYTQLPYMHPCDLDGDGQVLHQDVATSGNHADRLWTLEHASPLTQHRFTRTTKGEENFNFLFPDVAEIIQDMSLVEARKYLQDEYLLMCGEHLHQSRAQSDFVARNQKDHGSFNYLNQYEVPYGPTGEPDWGNMRKMSKRELGYASRAGQKQTKYQ